MAVHTIRVEETGETFRAREDQTVLDALAAAGRSPVVVGCRNGGCGVCRLEIVEGSFAVARPMSRAHVSIEDEHAGRVLACRIRATGDLRIRVARALRSGAATAGGGKASANRGEDSKPWR